MIVLYIISEEIKKKAQERENKEDSLLNKWKNTTCRSNQSLFIKDGIVDPERYEASKVKITFILKEVNSPTSKEWDLKEYVRNGGRASSWNNIARWTAGILFDKSFDEVRNMTEEYRKKYLAPISVVNLKKTPGLASSNYKEIRAHAIANRDQLKEQLNIYEPDIIICCGTGNIFVEDVLELQKLNWTKPNNSEGIWYLKDLKNDRWIVWTWHPQVRREKEFLYNALVPYIKELLKKE